MKLEEVLQTNNFKDEVHKASLNILYSSYWLKTNLASAIKDNGFTTEQYNVLRILKGKHPESMCVRDIADRMIEQNSNVPRIIHRLEIKHCIRRKPSHLDKRETMISLTEKGLELLQKATAAVNEVTYSIIGLNEDEATTLNDLLEKMRKSDGAPQ